MAISNDVLERWNRRRPGARPIRNAAPNPVVNAATNTRRARTNAARAVRSQGRSRRSLGGAAGFSSSPSRQQSAADYAYDTLVGEFQEAANKQRVMQNMADAGEDTGAGGQSDSWIGRTLDIMSRPLYGLSEGMQTLAEQNKQEMEEKGFWEQGGEIASDFFGGFWRGLSGEDKTGFGQVYEAVKENPSTAVGEYLRDFEEAHPTAEQWTARGIGAFGELVLDPSNLVFPTPKSVLRETGEALTRETLTGVTQTAARNAVDEVVRNSPFLRRSRYYLGRPDALAARVQAGMDDALNSTILETLGGGARHTRALNNATFPTTVSQRWQELMTDALSGRSEQHVQNLWNNMKTGLSPAYIDAARRTNPDFARFWDDLTNKLHGAGRVPFRDTDAVLAVLKSGKVGEKEFWDIWKNIKQGYHVELAPYTQKVFNAVENPVRRTLGYRVGNRVFEVPVVGKAFGWAGSKLGARASASGLGRILYETSFPGSFANRISRARAYGLNGLDNMVNEIRRVARGLDPATGARKYAAFSKDEARELFDALEKGLTTLGDARKDDALTWLRTKLDDVFDNEATEGVRGLDGKFGTKKAVKQSDYVYVHAKGGPKLDREKFFNGRQENYYKHNNVGEFNTQWAREHGLRPVDDAFQMLMLRYMKSGNDITKSSLWGDIIDNYATLGNHPTVVHAMDVGDRNLKAVSYGKLSQSYKDMVNRSGGKFYIPREIDDMVKQAEEMLNWTTAKWGIFGRSLATVMSRFKIGLTIPYPGFHMRNFIGDTMMGMLDGVLPTKYSEMIRKYTLNKAGRAQRIKIIPGIEYSFDEFVELFRKEANSGFINTEIPVYGSMTAGRLPRELGRKTGALARDLSDKRELLPRLTHYLHAYREEAQALLKKGTKLDLIEQRARDAALWRVNHYKFDYNALMPWEKSLKTLAFPFYTYMRKAMPTLLEQMFINPRYFTAVSRFQQYNDGSAADAFNSMNIPDWVRELGFGTLTDEMEPLAITGDVFPTGSLDILSSNSLQEASGDLISNLNPLAQIPFEQAYGRTMFDQRELPESQAEYFLDKLPLIGDVQREIVDIPGLPGQTNENTFWENLTGEGDRMNLLMSRLGGVNVLRRISEGQQEQQMETNWDRMVEDPIQQFNYSQGRWSINVSEQGVFSIYDKFTGQPTGAQFLTPTEALDYANRLPKFNENNASALRPPRPEDLVNMLSLQQ